MDELAIFTTAVQHATRAERDAYLLTVCADNDALRKRIAALLAAHDRTSGLLESPLLLDASADDELQPGARVGNYRLVEELGEGGFGVVYLAEQAEPVQRRVALKIIKLGMDTRQVVARFQAEQQTLALMEHPNIARVLDAGATESGRPYFVMEYVAGIPITSFCDQHCMSVRDRMRLLAVVCRAIQHAHQKAIIHRDIKPSNVLVSEDGTGHGPSVKVIDFGIAKALQPDILAEWQLTRDQQRLGTPAYMSPEQAAGKRDQIDTRSDVYALGALAYELLVGQPPSDGPTHETTGRIAERAEDFEPVTPSHYVAKKMDPSLARRWSTDIKRLRAELRGDVDWIVLTALAHDRERRYQSALSLAEDIERYLRDEPIEARPPNAIYRCRKFVRRHRTAIVVTIAPFLMLATYGITHQITRQSYVAENTRRVTASRHKIEKDIREAYKWYDPLRRRGNKDAESIGHSLEAARRAEALLDSAEADTLLVSRVKNLVTQLEQEQGELRFLAQMSDSRLGFPGASNTPQDEALEHFDQAFRALGIELLRGEPAAAAAMLKDRPVEVQQMAVAALDLWAISLSPSAKTERQWLQSTAKLADPDAWRNSLREAIEQIDVEQLARMAHDEQLERQPPPTLMVLATVLQQHKSQAAFIVLRRAADAYPDVYVFNAIVGNIYSRQGTSMDAEAIRRATRHLSSALAVRPDDVRILNTLATNLSRVGEHDDAVAMLSRAVEREPGFWYGWQNLSLALARQGNYDKSLEMSVEAIARMHEAGTVDNLNRIMRQNLRRIDLCVKVASAERIDIQNACQVIDNPSSEWRSAMATLSGWTASKSPWGTSLFRRASEWHAPAFLVQIRPDAFTAIDATTNPHHKYLFVVAALSRGEILINGVSAAKIPDSGGDPQAITCRSEALATLQAADNVVTVYAERTKPEAFLDLQLFRVDETKAMQRFEGIVSDLRTRLAEPVNVPSGADVERIEQARTAVRDAFESELTQMLTKGN